MSSLDSGLHYIPTADGQQQARWERLLDDYHWAVTMHSESCPRHGRIKGCTIRVSPDVNREFPWSVLSGVRFAHQLARTDL